METLFLSNKFNLHFYAHFVITDPIEDGDTKAHRRRWQKIQLLMVLGVIMIVCLVVVIIFQHAQNSSNNEVSVLKTVIVSVL